MSQGTLQILSSGALTAVQDFGRFSYADMGVLQAGAMDPVSMQAANFLVGNPAEEAVLECTLLGPELRFDVPCAFAIAGADMQPVLDGQRIPNNAAGIAKAGSVLKLGQAKKGLRAYIALKGGLDLEPVMGSRSTDLKCGIGGFEGRKLMAGDGIPLRAPDVRLKEPYKKYLTEKEEKKYLRHLYAGNSLQRLEDSISLQHSESIPSLRILWGPQADLFSDAARRVFSTNDYTLSADSDRMGCRFTGERIPAEQGTDIVSDGIAFGSVQITSAGLPIVMMADHQTTGGYAKIAAVITADLPILAQLVPGEKVRFVPVSMKEAEKAGRQMRKRLRQLKRAVD